MHDINDQDGSLDQASEAYSELEDLLEDYGVKEQEEGKFREYMNRFEGYVEERVEDIDNPNQKEVARKEGYRCITQLVESAEGDLDAVIRLLGK